MLVTPGVSLLGARAAEARKRLVQQAGVFPESLELAVVEVGADLVRQGGGMDAGVGGDSAGLVDEEVDAEVPGDMGRPRGGLQEVKDRVRLGAVDVDFVEDGKGGAVGAPSKGQNLAGRRGFLVAKVVAGKGENLQARLTPSLVEVDEGSVVGVGEASEGRDVGDERDLAAVPREVDDVAERRRRREVVERRRRRHRRSGDAAARSSARREHVPG
eukprot:CAMPEP_0197419990 /NCGR_PEP_ID=MMETSP1170-20131217/5470_1 /TAXON_ID=54406 /ORGANISM="Sarcinochrysis sp, Strain CCMP770" /LENGTH=214 /DNA_ID=CAMNT_0042947111 /DNA_START=143 /DNA_END=785 /DNA_ORIENTATION=-